jgi:hypothetical protein
MTEEGRVLPTEAATVAVLETAEAEKEWTHKEWTDKEGSLVVEMAPVAATAVETEAVEKDKETSLAAEMDAVENEVEAGTVEEGEGHDVADDVSADTEAVEKEGDESIEAGTVEEGGRRRRKCGGGVPG